MKASHKFATSPDILVAISGPNMGQEKVTLIAGDLCEIKYYSHCPEIL